jgi:hypothetical protein
MVASIIDEDVRRALENLQRLQQEQAKYQQVSFKEQLYQILSIQTRPHIQDPTIFLVDVFVRNASQEPVNISVVFAIPSVVSRLVSNDIRQLN